jgi:hypothetical protein
LQSVGVLCRTPRDIRRLLTIFMVTFVIGSAMLSLPMAIRAQTRSTESVSPRNCSKSDLEIHFGFFESPKNYFNLAVQGQNISDHACVFAYSLFDPRFLADSSPFKCRDCAKREREGYRNDTDATAYPLVRPGEIVSRQYRWRTTLESSSDTCFRPVGMDTEYSSTWRLKTPALIGESLFRYQRRRN